MDLGTVKKKIGDRKYTNLHEAAEDVRLVWKNCMTYNADGSDFFVLAKTLNKKFEEKYNKLLTDLRITDPRSTGNSGGSRGATGTSLGGGSTLSSGPSGATVSGSSGGKVDGSTGSTTMASATTNTTIITLDEKKSFARSLYKITKEELGKIILEVESKCPAALIKNMAEDEATLNVDKLSPPLFHDLKTFVATCIKNNNSSNNNATGPTTTSSSSASSSKKGTKRKKDT
jgi:hypothetical protein